jgi:hypothetical protein
MSSFFYIFEALSCGFGLLNLKYISREKDWLFKNPQKLRGASRGGLALPRASHRVRSSRSNPLKVNPEQFTALMSWDPDILTETNPVSRKNAQQRSKLLKLRKSFTAEERRISATTMTPVPTKKNGQESRPQKGGGEICQYRALTTILGRRSVIKAT